MQLMLPEEQAVKPNTHKWNLMLLLDKTPYQEDRKD